MAANEGKGVVGIASELFCMRTAMIIIGENDSKDELLFFVRCLETFVHVRSLLFNFMLHFVQSNGRLPSKPSGPKSFGCEWRQAGSSDPITFVRQDPAILLDALCDLMPTRSAGLKVYNCFRSLERIFIQYSQILSRRRQSIDQLLDVVPMAELPGAEHARNVSA